MGLNLGSKFDSVLVQNLFLLFWGVVESVVVLRILLC